MIVIDMFDTTCNVWWIDTRPWLK